VFICTFDRYSWRLLETWSLELRKTSSYGEFTGSSKRPANFQQMYSKYTC